MFLSVVLHRQGKQQAWSPLAKRPNAEPTPTRKSCGVVPVQEGYCKNVGLHQTAFAKVSETCQHVRWAQRIMAASLHTPVARSTGQPPGGAWKQPMSDETILIRVQ